MRNDLKLTLAFYGCSHQEVKIERLFDAVVEWLKGLGYIPNMLASNSQKKLCAFANIERGLRKRDFGDVTSFSMYASPEKSGMTYDAAAVYSGTRDGGGDFVVAIPAAYYTSSEWRIFSESMIEMLRPAYGIGFLRGLAHGPIPYTYGINQSPKQVFSGPEYEEKVIISRWLDVGMEKQVYRDGTLRDVFPLNFLSPIALTRDVGGKTLREYIAQPGHGTLTPIGDALQLWQLAESQVEQVRAELRPTGIVFKRKPAAIEGNCPLSAPHQT